MEILAIVIPVFAMLGLGIFSRKSRLLSQEGMAGLKTVAIQIMLPVVFFNAFGTNHYSWNSLFIFLIMFAVLLLNAGIGFIIRPHLKFGKYLPIMLTTFEGGLIGYPLFISVRGADRIAEIVTLDVAQCVFAGTAALIIVNALKADGKSLTAKELLLPLVRMPMMWGIFLGIFFGVTGILPSFVQSPAGVVYTSLVNMITLPLSALILICVGYDFRLEGVVWRPALKSVILRLALMMVMLGILVQIFLALGVYEQLKYALYLYLFLPPFFIGPMLIDEAKNREIFSTMISMYIIVTLLAYTIWAAMVQSGFLD